MLQYRQEKWKATIVKYKNIFYMLRLNEDFFRDKKSSIQSLYQVSVMLTLKSKTNNGFPTFEEKSNLEEVEKGLYESFHLKDTTFFVGVITGNNVREFIFYSDQIQVLKSKLVMALENSGYVYQVVVQNERESGKYNII